MAIFGTAEIKSDSSLFYLELPSATMVLELAGPINKFFMLITIRKNSV